MNIDNILLAADFSPASQAALQYAAVIAKRCNARVFVAHVIPESAFADVPKEILAEARARTVADLKARLEQLQYALKDLQLQFILEEGHVADTLLALTKSKSIDLVVVGTRGHRRIQRMLLGSIAEKLSRQSRCPVLVVPEDAVSYDSKVTVRTILCPTNFSERSIAALKHTWQFAKAFSSHIILLHVVDDSLLSRADRIARSTTVHERLSRLSSSLSSDGPSPETELVVEFGVPDRTIVKVAAERGTELIVLSIQRAKPVVAHLPPEITFSVAQQADCAVLTIAS
jgi:nucleotide-binding universal stress UspA family protein